MAYTTTAELRIAAGGQEALKEVSYNEDAATLALAQAVVDSEIDMTARRLHGLNVPFTSSADIAAIKGMAARETVRVLRNFARIPKGNDAEERGMFEAWLVQLAAGNVLVPSDPYPIGEGGGTPIAEERSTSTWTGALSRDDLKGFA